MAKKKVKPMDMDVATLASKLDEYQDIVHEQLVQLHDRITQLENVRANETRFILWFELAIDEGKKKEIEQILSNLGLVGAVVNGVKAPTLLNL